MATAEPPEDMITVARIARPQGIRGEVIADLLTDFPERFARLTEARAVWPTGKVGVIGLERARPHLGRIILKLKGCDSRNEAENLRDVRLMVRREQLVELPTDNYYHFDLVDCAVVTAAGLAVGNVVGVQDFGAAPLLVVKGDDGKERLIPLASSICTEVDVANKRIVIEPPDGLLEL